MAHTKPHPIRLQTYTVIARAVEEGVAYGLSRYRKYHDDGGSVDRDAIAEQVEREVLSALCAVIRFEED